MLKSVVFRMIANLWRVLHVRCILEGGLCSVVILLFSTVISCPRSFANPIPMNERVVNPPISKSEVVEMLTLSVLVLRVNDGATRDWIEDELRNKQLATKGEWSLSWLGENKHEGVAAGIFQHQGDNTFALAFKGQNQKNIDDLYHGLGIQWQDGWPYFQKDSCPVDSDLHSKGFCPVSPLPVYGRYIDADENVSLMQQTRWVS